MCCSFTQVVAVKQLDRNGFQGNREFLVEVLILSLLHHPNLVNLVGYCADGDQRILVYEYMPNGSLEDHLLGMSRILYLQHNQRSETSVLMNSVVDIFALCILSNSCKCERAQTTKLFFFMFLLFLFSFSQI